MAQSELQKLGTDIEINAEKLEDQREMISFIRNRDVFQILLACEEFVDWPRVIGGYSDETLRNIEGHGTEFQFSPALNEYIRATVRLEISKRNRGRRIPQGHGMDDQGKQE